MRYTDSMNIYSIPVESLDGTITTLEKYQGQVLLIVNTATKCGYASQLEGLESLYRAYKDRGFVVLGFPCNQFGNQDPGTSQESVMVCRQDHGTTFPMFARVDVNGKNTAALYTFLKDAKPGLAGKSIKWNYTKFLVDSNGAVMKRYASASTPESIEGDIKLLV